MRHSRLTTTSGTSIGSLELPSPVEQAAPPPERPRRVLVAAWLAIGAIGASGIAALVAYLGGAWTAAGHAPAPPAAREELLLWLLAVAVGAGVALAGIALHRQQALLAARADEAAYRDLYDNISEGVFRSTIDGRMISANPALARLNGYETGDELVAAVKDIASEWYVQPGRRAAIHEMLLEHGHVTNVVSEIYRHRTRERIWIEESTRLVRDEVTGAPLYYDGTVREVTETMRRLELQDRYSKIASIMSGCLLQLRRKADGVFCMPYVSIGLFYICGLHPEEVAEDSTVFRELIHPDDFDRVTSEMQRSEITLTPFQCEYRLALRDGTVRWIFAHSVPEREPDGSTLWHGYMTDISERKRTEARIHELAYFDSLTQLPNRAMLGERIRTILSSEARRGRRRALLFIDIDHFKMLNDTKGHHFGDLFLCEVARRISSAVGESDMVARLGGDEFVVLLQGLADDDADPTASVQTICDRILGSVDQPFAIGEESFQTTASIGATMVRPGDRDLEDLLKRADLAMYEAKAAGRGTTRFFRPELQIAAADRLALTSDLRRAHRDEALEIHLQPLIDRAGECIGAEALLRWNHPLRGPIPPIEFIPLAEGSGFMDSIDRWVLKSACRMLKSWENDPLMRGLRIAVNVSASELNQMGFADTVASTLLETGAHGDRLTLELTEHIMLDDIEAVSAVMQKLQSFGIRFALDDFGTGYSSLSYLKRLPIDTLKIDKSFVRDIETDTSGREIVQTILNIARSLHVSAVAEGVETEMQSLLLRQLGCHAFQGYYFAKPMPAADFRDYVASRTMGAERARKALP